MVSQLRSAAKTAMAVIISAVPKTHGLVSYLATPIRHGGDWGFSAAANAGQSAPTNGPSSDPASRRGDLSKGGQPAALGSGWEHSARRNLSKQAPVLSGQWPLRLGRRDVCATGSRRSFFGVSETTVHEERRLIQYSAEELFSVVQAVEHYQEFLPWCEKSTLHSRDDVHMRAELKVGFRGLSETYTSTVKMQRPRSVQVEAVDSKLFEVLRSSWLLQSGPQPDTCWLEFKVEFKFRSPLYNQVASIFLDEVVKTMILAFEKRCSDVFGPASLKRSAAVAS